MYSKILETTTYKIVMCCAFLHAINNQLEMKAKQKLNLNST